MSVEGTPKTGTIVEVISIRQDTGYVVQPDDPPDTPTIIVYGADVGSGLLKKDDTVTIP